MEEIVLTLCLFILGALYYYQVGANIALRNNCDKLNKLQSKRVQELEQRIEELEHARYVYKGYVDRSLYSYEKNLN